MNENPGPVTAEDDLPVTPLRDTPLQEPGLKRLTVRLLALTIAALLSSSLLQRYLGHVLAGPDIDFRDYYVAAQVVRDNPHAHLYEGATNGNPQLKSAPADSAMARRARLDGFEDIELYLYPPLFADLLTPLTRLPLRVAAQLWRLLNLGVVFGSVLLLARMVRIRVLSAEFVLVLTAAYAFWPVHEAVSLGQITVVLLGLWTVGVVSYAGGLTVLSAVVLALATAFKVTPLLFVPVVLVWRDRRWLLTYAVALLGFFAAMAAWNGPALLREYVHVIAGMGGTLPAIGNKCIPAVTAWLYYRRTFDLQTVHAVLGTSPLPLNLLSRVFSLAFYGTCLVQVWKGRRMTSRYDRALTLAVFALAAALLAPVSWRHAYTVALVPFVLLWERCLRERWAGWPLWSLAVASLAVGSLAFDLMAQGPVPQPLNIFLASLWPLSALCLCVFALQRLTQARAVP